MFPFPQAMLCPAGGAAIIGVSTVTNLPATNANTCINVPLPAGSAAGDLCVQIAADYNSSAVMGLGTPTGFTALFSTGVTGNVVNWTGWKVLTATDISNGYVPGPTGISNSTAQTNSGQSIVVLRGPSSLVVAAQPTETTASSSFALAGINKAARTTYVLAVLAGGYSGSLAFQINSLPGSFSDPQNGSSWQGGFIAVCKADLYADGTAETIGAVGTANGKWALLSAV